MDSTPKYRPVKPIFTYEKVFGTQNDTLNPFELIFSSVESIHLHALPGYFPVEQIVTGAYWNEKLTQCFYKGIVSIGLKDNAHYFVLCTSQVNPKDFKKFFSKKSPNPTVRISTHLSD